MKTFVLGPECSVETGGLPSPIERTAQAELIWGLKAVFGGSRPGGRRIRLLTSQNCPSADEACGRLDLGSLGKDGFLIDAIMIHDEEILVVAAKEERGLLYAVYTILEAMGACFLLDPPRFPRLQEYALHIPIRDGPAFSLRCASGVVCKKEDIPWYSKNRINLLLVRLWGEEFEGLAKFAARYGIELGVCGGDFTSDQEESKEVPVNRETGHLLCAALDETWEYLERLVTRRMEGLRSCRAYSFRLTDYRPNPVFTRCQSCARIPPAERILRSLSIAREAAKERGANIMFRTWGLDFMAEAYRHGSHQVVYGWDPEIHLGRIIEESPRDVMLVTKETWGDFMITYPPNHWIGLCKPHTQLIEYQVEPSEYRGNDTLPCSMVERWSRITRLARDRGVEGAWACSWGASLSINDQAPIGELLNSLNTHAFVRLSWDPDADIDAIYREWAQRIFPECPGEMVDIMRKSNEAVAGIMYVQGQRFNNHSGISGRLSHVEWCFHHYGFNDNGGTVTPGMLDPTEDNLERVIAEKDGSARAVRQMTSILDAAKDRMSPGAYQELQRMLEGMYGLARLWTEYARAFYLYAMLRSDWSDEKAERLRASCNLMVDMAQSLPDNSGFSGILWRGDQSPSLTPNIRDSVKSLVADYEDFLIGSRSPGLPRIHKEHGS